MVNDITKFNWNELYTEERAGDDRPFINMVATGEGTNKAVSCKFEESEPFHVAKDNYGNDKLIFRVTDVEGNKCLFSTSSKRCMAAMKEHLPIKGKSVTITRIGESFDTAYTIEEI